MAKLNPYGLTAARVHGQPGRDTRPTGVTIDIHSHAFSATAAAWVQPHLAAAQQNAPIVGTAATRELNRKQTADRHSRMTLIDERLADMDAMGLDMQIVSPAPGQCYHMLPPAIGVEAARRVNDGIAEYVARRPDRFVGIGTVPLQAGEAAAREAERCVKSLGFKGVEILTNVAGNELSEPAFAPFWAAAEALGTLVMIHPAGFTEARRLARFYFNNVIGNPFDTTVALHHLIFDGVLERHPRLKILAVHGGGYLASYSGRIDHAWGARPDAHGALSKPPSHYLRRIFFDSIVFTPHQLAYLIETFGVGQIVMGTDYPYDMGEYDPIGHVRAVAGLDAATVAAIVGGNAKRLLGL